MTFRFIWRLEKDGSFYEQDATNQVSFLEAYEDWSFFWGISATDCVAWKVELKNE